MNKLLEFLQSSSGELSSKRLGYLSTIPVACFGTIWLCIKFINSGHPELAVEIWNNFYIFSCVLGGFVSAEVIPNIISSFKNKFTNDKPNS